MKKLTCLLLLACLCLPMLGASAALAETAGPLEPCTVTMWVTYGENDLKKDFWRNAANAFEAANPGVKVDLQSQGGYDGVAEKLLAGTAANSLPTLAMIEVSFITMFHPIAEDLSKYIARSTIDNFIDGLMHTAYVDGTLRAIPFSVSSPGFYYNRDIFRELGLPEEGPKTWADVYEYAAKVTASSTADKPRYGFAGNWDSDCWRWESVLASTGDTVTTPDGKTVTFNTDGGKDIVKLWQKMIREGTMTNPYLGKDNNPFDDFAAGKAAMYFDSTAKYGAIVAGKASGDVKDDLAICIQPMMDADKGYGLVSGGANVMMCNTAAEAEKIAAGKLLDFFMRDEYVSGYFIMSGYTATTKSSLEYGETKERLAADPNYRTIVQQFDYLKPRPQTPQWREIYTMLHQYLQKALIEPTLDVDAMMTDAAAEAQRIIDRN